MDIEEDIVVSKEKALDLLREKKVPLSVRRHSIKVAETAYKIASRITKKDADKELVLIGGLLHDIGRAETHGFDHALLGGQILREEGFPEKYARICETHILGGLDKSDAKNVGLPERDYLPETLEEKIVCLADKMTMGKKHVSIEERFKQWFEKYGKSRILVKSKKRIEKIKKEIESLL
ncbi:MAG: hypothetical protein BAJALOKI1v1_120010 [Promethearchaeota archaeon]|nr:MAG: hypothetical protein BAJALOKI1v1_120010 [Candidatus Lokiarchaeota archaeon]